MEAAVASPGGRHGFGAITERGALLSRGCAVVDVQQSFDRAIKYLAGTAQLRVAA
jgi:hypothetical protein